MVMLHFVLYVRPQAGGEFAGGRMPMAGIVGQRGAGAVFPSNARRPAAADTGAA